MFSVSLSVLSVSVCPPCLSVSLLCRQKGVVLHLPFVFASLFLKAKALLLLSFLGSFFQNTSAFIGLACPHRAYTLIYLIYYFDNQPSIFVKYILVFN